MNFEINRNKYLFKKGNENDIIFPSGYVLLVAFTSAPIINGFHKIAETCSNDDDSLLRRRFSILVYDILKINETS